MFGLRVIIWWFRRLFRECEAGGKLTEGFARYGIWSAMLPRSIERKYGLLWMLVSDDGLAIMRDPG